MIHRAPPGISKGCSHEMNPTDTSCCGVTNRLIATQESGTLQSPSHIEGPKQGSGISTTAVIASKVHQVAQNAQWEF